MDMLFWAAILLKQYLNKSACGPCERLEKYLTTRIKIFACALLSPCSKIIEKAQENTISEFCFRNLTL